LVTTAKIAKKTKNLRNKPILYFSIDDENFPYKGVKGKGFVTIVEDPNRAVSEGEKNKYEISWYTRSSNSKNDNRAFKERKQHTY
jgi:hypothetical protein